MSEQGRGHCGWPVQPLGQMEVAPRTCHAAAWEVRAHGRWPPQCDCGATNTAPVLPPQTGDSSGRLTVMRKSLGEPVSEPVTRPRASHPGLTPSPLSGRRAQRRGEPPPARERAEGGAGRGRCCGTWSPGLCSPPPPVSGRASPGSADARRPSPVAVSHQSGQSRLQALAPPAAAVTCSCRVLVSLGPAAVPTPGRRQGGRGSSPWVARGPWARPLQPGEGEP